MAHWTANDIPDQSGRTVLVTGANSGLGLRTAQTLAAHNARVLIACRSPERGADALAAISGGSAELIPLDLADPHSVREAAQQIRDRTGDRLDVLVNNAGVMMPPKQTTAGGFELQFGTNHLGHAALTWLLMPALRARPGARVVTVSSPAARLGRMDLADPNFERRYYLPVTAYGQSKLANLLFAFELDRRASAAGLDLVSVAAHPGYTATNLNRNMARSRGGTPLAQLLEYFGDLGDRWIAQGVETGALPQLYAATAPGVRGGEYYGPDGFGEMRGYPRRVNPPRAALDAEVAAKLWALTAEFTGVQPDPA